MVDVTGRFCEHRMMVRLGTPQLSDPATRHPQPVRKQAVFGSQRVRLARNRQLVSVTDLALQRAAGNRALARLLARAPKKKEPSWLTSTPKEHMPGDPVPGYESARAQYTDTDRSKFIAAVEKRREENEAAVKKFLGDWSSELVKLWGHSLTEEMAKAAAHSEFDVWESLMKFIIKESVIALLTGGAGLGYEALELGAELPLFEEEAIGFATDLAADKTEAAVTGTDTEHKVASAKEKLDSKTDQLAGLVKKMDANQVSDTPWAYYGAWLATASLPDLARFRLPPRLPTIPTQEVSKSVAAAIVGAIHEPHSQSNLPGRRDPHTGDWSDQDPTDDDPISFFDDNVAIVHLTMGGGHEVAQNDAEIYTPSPVLLRALVGQQLRQMPGVPLFIVVDPQPDSNWQAAKQMIAALRRALPGLLPQDAFPETDEYAAFATAYPQHEKEEMRVIRSFPGGTEHLTASGGGFAEQLWLYRWGHGDDLTSLANEILREGELENVRSSESQASGPSTGTTKALGASSPAELASLTATRLSMPPGETEHAMKRLLAEYVLGLIASKPEDRWSPTYWRTGTRSRLYQRDPKAVEGGAKDRREGWVPY